MIGDDHMAMLLNLLEDNMLPAYKKLCLACVGLSVGALTACGGGNDGSAQLVRDIISPVLIVSNEPSSVTKQPKITIQGNVSDNTKTGLSVTITNKQNNISQRLDIDKNGDFLSEVNLKQGKNEYVITAIDEAGNKTEQKILIVLDNIAPKIDLANDLKEAVSRTSDIILSGKVTDNASSAVLLTVDVNGRSVQDIDINSSGDFKLSLALEAGDNTIQLSAKDKAGNESVSTQHVYFGNTLTAANSHTGALVNGKLYAWGRNNFGQVGMGEVTTLKNNNHPTMPVLIDKAPANIVSISFNQNHSALLTKEGKVYTWGSDTNGELGRGNGAKDSCGKQKNNCRLDIGLVEGLSDVIAISSGYAHKLALTKTGDVWAFGNNSQGQLGQDTATIKNSDVPVKVNFSANANMGKIIQVIASSDASYALDNKGQVWAWGSNEYGNLGKGLVCDEYDITLTPNCIKHDFIPSMVLLPNKPNVTELAVGRDHVLALTDKGHVYGWGLNLSSQVGYKGDDKVGTGDAWEEVIDKPTLLPWSTTQTVKHIYANGTTSYAMLNNRKIYPWGIFGETNAEGKTEYVELSIPTDKLPNLTDVNDMAVGALHQIAKRNNHGGIFSWGWSFEGSLGGENITNIWMYNTPIVVAIQ